MKVFEKVINLSFFVFFIAVFLILFGFNIKDYIQVSKDKHEWSLVQVYSHKYENLNNDTPYIYENNIQGTNYSIVGFPRTDKLTGYVVILANAIARPPNGSFPPDSSPLIKYLPDVAFRITKEVFTAIKHKVQLSPEVGEFLISRVRG